MVSVECIKWIASTWDCTLDHSRFSIQVGVSVASALASFMINIIFSIALKNSVKPVGYGAAINRIDHIATSHSASYTELHS